MVFKKTHVLAPSFVINCLRLHPFPPLHNCNRHMHHHCPHSLRMSFPMMMKLLWFSPAPLVVVTNLSSYFRINVLKIRQMEILKSYLDFLSNWNF